MEIVEAIYNEAEERLNSAMGFVSFHLSYKGLDIKLRGTKYDEMFKVYINDSFIFQDIDEALFSAIKFMYSDTFMDEEKRIELFNEVYKYCLKESVTHLN